MPSAEGNCRVNSTRWSRGTIQAFWRSFVAHRDLPMAGRCRRTSASWAAPTTCHPNSIRLVAGAAKLAQDRMRRGARAVPVVAKSCKRYPEISPPMLLKRQLPVAGRCWSMTAIAGSAATGRATGRSSRATASITGRIRKWRRNIPRSHSPIFSARCNTSRPTDSMRAPPRPAS